MSSQHSIRKVVEDEFNKIFEDEKIAINMELTVFNYTIQLCESKNIKCQWEDFMFISYYKHRAYTILYNIENQDSQELYGLIKKEPNFNYDKVFVEKQIDKHYNTNRFGISNIEMQPSKWADIIEKDRQRYNTDESEEISNNGLFHCKKCKSKRTTYTQAQLRGGDESMSILVKCHEPDCNHNFRIG